MKTVLSLAVGLLALTPLHAQVFRPEALNGALLGGIAGAVIGNNSGHHNGARGAAVGAGVGLLLGQAIGDSNAVYRGGYYGGGGYVYRGDHGYYGGPAVSVGIGYSRGNYGRGGYRHGGYVYGRGYRPTYRYSLGYFPGYDLSTYPYYGGYRTAPYYYPAQPVVVQAAQPVQTVAEPAATQPQQITIINNYYNTTPMSAANGLFGR